MSRRLRFLAALLALVTFSAYFAEGVWASLCFPGADSHVVITDESTGGHGPGAVAHHAPAHGTHDKGPEGSDPPRCPRGMNSTGSSCVAVSLPATVNVMAHGVPAQTVAPLLRDSASDLLLISSLFRPPRV